MTRTNHQATSQIVDLAGNSDKENRNPNNGEFIQGSSRNIEVSTISSTPRAILKKIAKETQEQEQIWDFTKILINFYSRTRYRYFSLTFWWTSISFSYTISFKSCCGRWTSRSPKNRKHICFCSWYYLLILFIVFWFGLYTCLQRIFTLRTPGLL